MNKFNHYTNENLIKGINKLARQVTNDNFVPALVIGVLRGGVVPAVYLSHWFQSPMVAIEWSTRDNAVGKQIDQKIFDTISKNKKVLLVDDICDSGLTLNEIVSEIKGKTKLDNIRTAVLHYNSGQTIFKPDYYHLEINKEKDDRWIVYSWEDV